MTANEHEDLFEDDQPIHATDEDQDVDERAAGIGAWGISIVVHVLVLLIVATVVVVSSGVTDSPPVRRVMLPEVPQRPEPLTKEIKERPPVPFVTNEEVKDPNPIVTPIDAVEEINSDESLERDLEPVVQGREDAPADSEMAAFDLAMAIGAGRNAAGKNGFSNRGGPNRKRAAQRLGGTQGSESAVESSLRWFAMHQSPNGQWDVDGYAQNCTEEGAKCEPGRGHTGRDGDTACTGYALLCYLGAGYDHTHLSRWRKTVKAGLEWLVSAQNADGSWGRNYENGVCAMALAEAYALSGDATLRDPAQRAVDYLISVQAKDGPADNGYAGLGWDYVKPNLSRMDSSVSGWCVMALKSAKAAGLDTGNALEGCSAWLDGAWQACNPDWRNLGSGDRSYFPYTWNKTANTFQHQRLSCVGLLAAVFLGKGQGDAMLETLANTAVEEQMPTAYPCNTYWMYYNTLGVFQVGGKHWDTWNSKVRDMLVKAQRQDSACFTGSWDWQGTAFHGNETGRLLSTAYCCLSLEVYYRYMPLAIRR